MIHEPFPGQAPYGELIIGHEYAGTVAAVGETLDELQVGDRVAVEAHNGCGRCRNCRLGDYTSCLNYGNPKKATAQRPHHQRAYAEYVVNHLNTVHRLPASVSFRRRLPGHQPGLRAVRLEPGRLPGGGDVLVIGAGPLGLVSAAGARALAANRIFLSDVLASRLAVGLRVGADRAIDGNREDPLRVVLGGTEGLGVDYAVESSGSQAGLDLAVKATRRNGRSCCWPSRTTRCRSTSRTCRSTTRTSSPTAGKAGPTWGG